MNKRPSEWWDNLKKLIVPFYMNYFLVNVIRRILNFMRITPSSGVTESKASAKIKKLDTLELTSIGSPETINPEIMIEETYTPEMSSNYHYLIDNGHGGWIIDEEHPEGYYPTAGKRSPKDPDTGEVVIYEGVNNRINAKLIVDELTRMRISASLLVPEEEDISLKERIERANNEHSQRKCVIISIHSNAAGSDGKWANAKGISLHIAKNRSKTTDQLVTIMEEEFKHDFNELTKWRGVKINDFYMTRKSHSPSILCEIGFHDCLIEAKKMKTDQWRMLLVKSISHAIITFEDSTPKMKF